MKEEKRYFHKDTRNTVQKKQCRKTGDNSTQQHNLFLLWGAHMLHANIFVLRYNIPHFILAPSSQHIFSLLLQPLPHFKKTRATSPTTCTKKLQNFSVLRKVASCYKVVKRKAKQNTRIDQQQLWISLYNDAILARSTSEKTTGLAPTFHAWCNVSF